MRPTISSSPLRPGARLNFKDSDGRGCVLTGAEVTEELLAAVYPSQNEHRIAGINLITAVLFSFTYKCMQQSNFIVTLEGIYFSFLQTL